MLIYILLARLNGTVVGLSRTMNARISAQSGPFKASLCNHLVGFLFLTVILMVVGEWKFDAFSEVPSFAYLGGFFGALFVVVNSYVFPRVGAMNTALLVISGQLISAVLIDFAQRNIRPSIIQCFGILMVLAGIYLTRRLNRS